MGMASCRVTDRTKCCLVPAYPLCVRQSSEELLILWSQSQGHGHFAMIPEWYRADMLHSLRVSARGSAAARHEAPTRSLGARLIAQARQRRL